MMEQIEITAEIFKVIRANSDRNAKSVMHKIKQHLPDVTNQQIAQALEDLYGKRHDYK